MDGVLARLLYARGVETAAQAEAFLSPDESRLRDPLLLPGVTDALAILRFARDEHVRVAVYGDYDVDGMCATALMAEALTSCGVSARPHTPSREAGYGLHEEDIRALAGECGVLLTVDLGVTNAAEVRAAQALGMRVIVTDHHQLGLEPCPADALVSPLLGAYPFRRLCGTGVAYKLAQALVGREAAAQWLDLAALATVADVVPLLDENRALVACGLPVIASGARPGLKALLDVSGAARGEVDSETLGFQLGPRLNAAGRMGTAGPALQLLLTRDAAEADALAHELDDLNALRKRTERDVLAQAEKQAEAFDFVGRRLLCVQGDGWHTGVIGLAAGRLCQRYDRPVIALSKQDGLLHGSLRSIPGVNIHSCLQACDELLLRYGGHEQAAGVTLDAANGEAFLARLETAVAASAAPECFLPAAVYDAEIGLDKVTQALVDQLKLLRPFGYGNPSPLLLARGLAVDRKRACGADGAHLQLTLRQGGAVLDGIAFGMGGQVNALPPLVDACFAAKENEYRGRVSLQCEVKAWAPAADAPQAQLAALTPEDWRFALLDALPCSADVPSDKAPAASAVQPVHGTTAAPAASAAQTAPGTTATPAAPATQPVPGTTAVPACAERPQAGFIRANGELYQDTAVLSGEALDGVIDGWLQATEGALLVARTAETAARALARWPERLTLCTGAPDDARCFHALVILPRPERVPRGYRHVALLDGEALPDELASWRARLPRAQAVAAEPSAALRTLAASADAGDEAYRVLYKALRGADCRSLAEAAKLSGLTPAQAHAGLTAFAQLGLLTYRRLPFAAALLPPVKCALGDSPLLAALRALTTPRKEAAEC